MVFVPDQLLWEITKKNTSFMKKKNGRTARSGTISFSVEPGNLKNISSAKYSGLSNPQTIDVVCGEDNRATLITKAKSRSGKNQALIKTNVSKDFGASVSTIDKVTSSVYYRTDLKKDVLGKYTKVYNANRRAKGIKKPVPVKKGRGKLGSD